MKQSVINIKKNLFYSLFYTSITVIMMMTVFSKINTKKSQEEISVQQVKQSEHFIWVKYKGLWEGIK